MPIKIARCDKASDICINCQHKDKHVYDEIQCASTECSHIEQEVRCIVIEELEEKEIEIHPKLKISNVSCLKCRYNSADVFCILAGEKIVNLTPCNSCIEWRKEELKNREQVNGIS